MRSTQNIYVDPWLPVGDDVRNCIGQNERRIFALIDRLNRLEMQTLALQRRLNRIARQVDHGT